MKKRDYKKKKKVSTKNSSNKKSFINQLDTAIPYLIFVLVISGCIFYYLQFCLKYSYDSISPTAFASGNYFKYINPHPKYKDEGMKIGNKQIIEHGPRDKKEIALTFDADMTEMMESFLQSGRVKTYTDNRITDFLIQNKIKSTMFLTGLWMEHYPKETKIMASNPLFELANHSYSHPSFAGKCYGLPQVPSSQYAEEIEKTQKMLEMVANKKTKYFRFPGGCYDQKTLDLVKRAGMIPVHWDAIADDGFNSNTQNIISNVLNQTQNGSIIVMHLGGEPNTPKTFEALQAIYARLKQKGYKFVTVSELLDRDSETQAVDLRKYVIGLLL